MYGAPGLMQQGVGAALNSMASDAAVQTGHRRYGRL